MSTSARNKRSRDELLDILISLSSLEFDLLITRMELPLSMSAGTAVRSGARGIEVFRHLETSGRLDELDARLSRGVLQPPSPEQRGVAAPPVGHLRLSAASLIDVALPSGERRSQIQGGAALQPSRAPLRRQEASAPSTATTPSGIALSFDLSNLNTADLRLVALRIQVVDYYPAQILGVTTHLGVGHERRYVCGLGLERAAAYRCEKREAGYDFIKLAPAEMEFFSIELRAAASGLYVIRPLIEYSVAGSSGQVVGEALDLVFHDGKRKQTPLRREKNSA